MMDQGSQEWFEARLGNVTASRIYDVMMKPTTAGYQNYKTQLVVERLTGQPTETFTSAAMQHGTDTEPQARAMYELATGNGVVETGFVPHPDIEWGGASPDGLIGDTGLVEIKCPQQTNHMNALLGKSIDRRYLLQMQWQMVCTGRNWCDFVSFNDDFPHEMKLKVERIPLDANLSKEITEAVTTFLKQVAVDFETLSNKYKEAA